jgi:hypothetical protein
VAAGRREIMDDKISAPPEEYVEINAARPCLENFSMPGMNLVFAIRSPTDSQDDFSPEILLKVLKGLLLMVFVPLYWLLIGLNWIK